MNVQAANAKAAATSPALILLREDHDGIAVLTLNRPAARNSLSEALLQALGDALTAIAHDRKVRVVVLAANGPASAAASFATPGVNIGLFCSTPMVALSRNVSRKAAMEMLLTGELIPAEDAARIGLVNHVVAAGHEHAEALKLAEKIAAKSALTVKIGKEAFYKQAEMPLAGAYKYAADVMVENMLARDAEEGISAFIEKRNPKWQDK
jgi:enoyl-CoA hydratase/carnithine racemase